MRVVIITASAPHHKQFCMRVASRHEVVGVIHPVAQNRSLAAKARRAQRRLTTGGPMLGVLRVLAKLPGPLAGWHGSQEIEKREGIFFADASRGYEQARLPSIEHQFADVNGPAAVDLIRSLEPDVVLCLGGPIYREPLIAACGMMINFHSGISPLYNGASSVLFAFANGHLDLCGGTLMTMSPVVDGGDILAHYLPAIEADDDPATLFLKTVRGAPEVASDFLDHFEKTGTFTRVPQTPPLFYTTGADWTIREGHKVRRLLQGSVAGEHVREERVIRYWDLKSDDEAAEKLRLAVQTLLRLR